MADSKLTHLLTRKEAAEYLNITLNTLCRWMKKDTYEMPYVRIGKSIRYRKEDLISFVDRHVVKSGNE